MGKSKALIIPYGVVRFIILKETYAEASIRAVK